jgi:DNA-binding MarR family transcriptional regulator
VPARIPALGGPAILWIEDHKHCYYRQAVNHNVAFLSSDIGRLFRKRFAADARHFGVTGPQWRMLAAIQRDPGTTQGALAAWLEVEPITAGRMIDRLERMGLVERRDDPADRRCWCMHLTPKGDALITSMSGYAQAVIANAVSGFSDDEQAQLLSLLNRVRANLADDAPPEASLSEMNANHGRS